MQSVANVFCVLDSVLQIFIIVIVKLPNFFNQFIKLYLIFNGMHFKTYFACTNTFCKKKVLSFQTHRQLHLQVILYKQNKTNNCDITANSQKVRQTFTKS